MGGRFPRTPALSPGERESRRLSWFGFVLLEGSGDGLLHYHRLVEGAFGGCGNARVRVESEYSAIAPGGFHQVKEEAAIGILDSARERSCRHFRRVLTPGAGEVLVQHT